MSFSRPWLVTFVILTASVRPTSVAAQDVSFARSRSSNGAGPNAEPHMHLRLGVGMGGLHLAGAGARYDGATIDFDFGIGKDVTPRDTILFTIRAMLAPTALADSTGALRGFGPNGGSLGLLYMRYLVPAKVFVGGGLDLLFYALSGNSVETRNEVGPALRFVVGREWSVAEGVALGLAATVIGAYMHQTSGGDPPAPPTSLGMVGASLAFTLAFR